MVEQRKLTVDGLFRLVSPLHISDVASNYRYFPQHDEIRRAVRGGFPAVGHRNMTFYLPAARSDRNPSGMLTVPVLPANGLRGRLRRAAAQEIEEILCTKTERLKVATYHGMHCGAVTGNPDSSPIALSKIRVLRDHVFLGLFGGGARMMPGRLQVATGYPVVEGLVDAGFVPDRWPEEQVPTADAWRLTQAIPLVRGDDTHTDPNAPQVIADFDAVSAQQLQDELARRAQRAGEDSENRGEDNVQRGLRALSAVQAVTPGTPLYVCFTVQGTAAQCGLLLYAILRLLQHKPRALGGKTASGYGRFHHELSVKLDDNDREPSPFRGQAEDTLLDPTGSCTADLIQAVEDALSRIEVAELDRLIQAQAA